MNAFQAKMNLLAKWRSLLAGWQLGTRPTGDPENDAVRDQREMLLLMRMELSALTSLFLKKGVFTVEEFQNECMTEADHLMQSLEQRFPGAKATETGMQISLLEANPWLSKFRP